MVPVIDKENKPLMPCTEKRAKLLMDRKQAKPYYKKGIFCIKLLKEPSDRSRQTIALGIDTGSKREGYTIATKKCVILNITTNTPDWIKQHLEIRKEIRRTRRNRKTPFRKCRTNRASLISKRINPSIKARWDSKIRIIKFLLKIIPISIINIEDIKAGSKKNKSKWNKSFSPLQWGKEYFNSQIECLGITLIKTSGRETYKKRNLRGFNKSSDKLSYIWKSHNVDSHILCELVINKDISPKFGIYKLEFLRFHRRQIHRRKPKSGNIRSQYGGTVSLGVSRGSVVKYKRKLYYLGGTSEGKVSLHDTNTGKRVKRAEMKEIKILYNSKWRVKFLTLREQN